MDIKSIVVGELTKQAEASVPELKSRINKYIIETVQSKEVDDLSDKISYLSGRINGGKH